MPAFAIDGTEFPVAPGGVVHDAPIRTGEVDHGLSGNYNGWIFSEKAVLGVTVGPLTELEFEALHALTLPIGGPRTVTGDAVGPTLTAAVFILGRNPELDGGSVTFLVRLRLEAR